MARRSVVGICAVVVVGWVQAGCEDPAGVSPDATFALVDDRVVIAVGDQLTLDMEGMDQGRALDRRDVTWTSSDPTTVDVDDGVIRARAPGVVLVRGEAGRARDSVRVRVRLRDLEGGQVAARVQGSSDAGADRFRGIASVNESLIGAFPTFSTIRQLSGELGDPETFQMELNMPGTPEVGETLLGAAKVIELDGHLADLAGPGGWRGSLSAGRGEPDALRGVAGRGRTGARDRARDRRGRPRGGEHPRERELRGRRPPDGDGRERAARGAAVGGYHRARLHGVRRAAPPGVVRRG